MAESSDDRIDLLVNYGIMDQSEAVKKKLNLRQQPASEKIRIENAKRDIASIESDTILPIKFPRLSILVD